jgi:hypothetical protein
MRTFFTVIALIIIAILAVIFFTGDDELATVINTPTPTGFITATTSPGAGGGPEEFDLEEQSNSNEEGTVSLTQTADGKLKVVLEVDNAPSTAQPAHFHNGTCENLGSIRYNLNSVVNGRSETTLNLTLVQLAAQLPLAVNVHSSAANMGTNVACADIDL